MRLLWITIVLFVVSLTFSRNVGEYMRGTPPTRTLQITYSCPQSCIAGSGRWDFKVFMAETFRGGQNRYYEYSRPQSVELINNLGIGNIVSGLSLSQFAGKKAKDMLKDKDLANRLAAFTGVLKTRVSDFVKRFALSGQDKIIVRLRLQGSDGKWVVYPVVFYGDGQKITSPGLQPEEGGMKRIVAFYFPVINSVDLFVNDVIGNWPPPPSYQNRCPDGFANCYGKYIVRVFDSNLNMVYDQTYTHSGTYDNNPEGFIKNVLIPLMVNIDEEIDSATVFFFRAGQYYYNEDKGRWNVALDYNQRLLRYMNIYVKNWVCRGWGSCCSQNGCFSCCIGGWECRDNLALRRFYRYDNEIEYTYSIRQMAELYDVRKRGDDVDWTINMMGLEDMSEQDFNFRLYKQTGTCGLTPDYVAQRLINPGAGRTDLLEIQWFQSLGDDNPIRTLAPATEVNDVITIDCCHGPCGNPADYDPCRGFPP